MDMRTADEIIKTLTKNEQGELSGIYWYSTVIKAINEARIEAIKECAEKMYDYYDSTWGFDQVQFENDLIEQVK